MSRTIQRWAIYFGIAAVAGLLRWLHEPVLSSIVLIGAGYFLGATRTDSV